MSITKAFVAAFERKIEKGWDKIFVVVDIHDTIIRACYEEEEHYEYFPMAKEALQALSDREDVCLILWSGCYPDKLAAYREHFAEDGILFEYGNENPEVGNTALSCFDEKLYFNVGIDDKFGFDPTLDWSEVLDVLEMY